jgi:hypothetical protein
MASTTSIQSSTASMNAAAPTMETQMQQVRYADANHTRGAAQLRDGDPMDFGVLPYARDPYDERARIIRDIAVGPDAAVEGEVDAYGRRAAVQLLGIPPNQVQRTLPITDQDIDYVHRWEAQQQEFMFDKWIMSQFDMSKPAERDRVMKLFPRYHQRQKALVDSKLALMKKWIEIQMFGIRSEDDGRFLFNVYAGVIQLPQGYHSYGALTNALNPVNPANSPGPYQSGRLADRGLFNPLRYIKFETAAVTSGFNPNTPAYPMPLADELDGRAAEGLRQMGDGARLFGPSTVPNQPFPLVPRNYQ